MSDDVIVPRQALLGLVLAADRANEYLTEVLCPQAVDTDQHASWANEASDIRADQSVAVEALR